MGDSLTLDVFGLPDHAVIWGLSLACVDDGTDFNLAEPFTVLASFRLGPTGHVAVPITVPTSPVLSGVSVWSQFTQRDLASAWGGKRLWSVPEELRIQ